MDIRLDVKGITTENSRKKYLKAIEVLADRMAVDVLCKAKKPKREELLPVLQSIMTHWEKKIRKRQRNLIIGMAKHFGLMQKAIDDKEPFTVSGKPVWNPKTGIAMTRNEWTDLSTQMDTYFTNACDQYGYNLASESSIAGIFDSMIGERQKEMENWTRDDFIQEHKKMLSGPVSDFNSWLDANNMTADDYRVSINDLDRTAQYCTDMADNVKGSIRNLFRVATNDGWDNWRIGQAMFDQYGDLNKDWDRILRTETNDAFSDGYIQNEATKDPGEDIYFIGRSSANACPICKRDINAVIVKYSNSPMDDENIDDPYAEKAIWAGKSSVGHGAKESYAVISRHPWCACRWVRYIPE